MKLKLALKIICCCFGFLFIASGSVFAAACGTANGNSYSSFDFLSNLSVLPGYSNTLCASGSTFVPPFTVNSSSWSWACSSAWTTKASNLGSNTSAASVTQRAETVNGKIYVIGGRPGATNLVTEYNPSTNTWTTKASMPTTRLYFSTAVVNNKIYVIGGNNGGSAFAVNEMYDPSTDTWTTKASSNSTHSEFVAIALNNKVYAIGGNILPDDHNNEMYDPSANTWTYKAPLHNGADNLGNITTKGAGGGVINNIIYITGGYANSGEWLGTKAYNPSTDTWTTKAYMPTLRGYLATAVYNNKLYAIGGRGMFDVGGGTLVTGQLIVNEEYDPSLDSSVSCSASKTSTPPCTSWTYSSWGACQSNNTQTRTITSYSPSGCTGGSPASLTQSCTYTPAVSGSCGYWVEAKYTDSEFNSSPGFLCSSGTAVGLSRPFSTTGSWYWTCNGSNGGSNVSCCTNAYGDPTCLCGSAYGVPTTTKPLNGTLCSNGGTQNKSGTYANDPTLWSGSWYWVCSGTQGNYYCHAPALPIGACGSEARAAHRYLTSGSTNLCASGNTVINFTGTTGPWSWKCRTASGDSPTCNASFSNAAPTISTITGVSTINEGATLGLNATATDADGDTSLSYSWTCTGGSLANGNTATPTYTAPMVTSNTTYICTVTVSDIFGGSVSRSVNITVNNVVSTGTCPTNTGNLFTTPGICTWVVPPEVTSIGVNLCGGGAGGGAGGGGSSGGYYAGGGGGGVGGAAAVCNTSTISVTPGQVLTIKVGAGGGGGSGSGSGYALEGVCPSGMTSGGTGYYGSAGQSSTINSTLVVGPGGTNDNYYYGGGAGGGGAGCYGSTNGNPGGGGGSGNNSICPITKGTNGNGGGTGGGWGDPGVGGAGGSGCGAGGGGGGGGARYGGAGGAGGAGANGFVKITINSVVGACGSEARAAHRYLTSGSTNLCASGNTVINFTGTTGPWSWKCRTASGDSPTCNASFSNAAPTISTITGATNLNEGTTVGLSVVATDPDGDIRNYSWTCTGGSLANGNTANPTYTAPMVANNTTNTCTVTVSDIFGANASRTMNITTNDNPVVGACGTANGQRLTVAPTLPAQLCNTGDPSPATPTLTGNTWNWTCVGSSTVSCSATKTLPNWTEQ